MTDRFLAYSKTSLQVHMFLPIVFLCLLGLSLAGCMGGVQTSKSFPETKEEFETKRLTPAPGESLIYFYYSRVPSGKSTTVTLDGDGAKVVKDVYMVWEVEPGEHQFVVEFERMLSDERFQTDITTEADRSYYYRLTSTVDSSNSTYDVNVYYFLEADEGTGQKKVQNHRLLAWYRDGVPLFQQVAAEPEQEGVNMSMSSETSEPTISPAPVATPEIPSVPEAEPEAALPAVEAAPEATPTPELVIPEVEATLAATPEEQPQDQAMKVQGRYYALVIGISQYEHLDSLATAVNDAEAVAESLRGYGFKVNTLLNEKATRERILDSLDVFQRLLEPEDKLLIYYAGHGQREADGQTAYWLPVNATQDSVSQWIIADTITASIKRIPATQILVVADSVYSGTLQRALQADLQDAAARLRYLEKIADKQSRLVMTSGANQPMAGSAGSEFSLFADAFVTGLTDMDQPLFTAEELFFGSIREIVAGQSDQLPEFQVIRNSGHQGGDFMFVKP